MGLLVTVRRSMMWSRNNVGDRIDSWETPMLVGSTSEEAPSTTTCRDLPESWSATGRVEGKNRSTRQFVQKSLMPDFVKSLRDIESYSLRFPETLHCGFPYVVDIC